MLLVNEFYAKSGEILAGNSCPGNFRQINRAFYYGVKFLPDLLRGHPSVAQNEILENVLRRMLR